MPEFFADKPQAPELSKEQIGESLRKKGYGEKNFTPGAERLDLEFSKDRCVYVQEVLREMGHINETPLSPEDKIIVTEIDKFTFRIQHAYKISSRGWWRDEIKYHTLRLPENFYAPFYGPLTADEHLVISERKDSAVLGMFKTNAIRTRKDPVLSSRAFNVMKQELPKGSSILETALPRLVAEFKDHPELYRLYFTPRTTGKQTPLFLDIGPSRQLQTVPDTFQPTDVIYEKWNGALIPSTDFRLVAGILEQKEIKKHGLRIRIDKTSFPPSTPDALKNLPEDLQFAPGIQLIVGYNGSGKSSFLNALYLANQRALLGKDVAVHITEHSLEWAQAFSKKISIQEDPQKILRLDIANGLSAAQDRDQVDMEGGAALKWSRSKNTSTRLSRDWFLQEFVKRYDLKNFKGIVLFDEFEMGIDPWRHGTIIDEIKAILHPDACVIISTNSPILVLNNDLPRLDLRSPEKGVFNSSASRDE